ncbi:MAG TPA: carboxyltransferase domain-containing protein, partial [Opitutus sp.]|nr:carboxyltransferase domain-containing protein [Opitutus sp.]
MTFAALGDSAVVVTLGATIDEATLRRVRSTAATLQQAAGIVDVVPAYGNVAVFYDVTFFSGG